ncbi:sulfur-oxidizing protein SoxY [Paucibacter oligotrophus]|uniref:Sulfur-oxidizing protein SoxY n=1 Tax=Roseateles oligotrophus TaxID=1769250 RepID=A0A840L1Q2_9BURK|nr:quinoprotein dehydrogenase-associated SoxYZ-like carrier [Roseateles oligotrophus]MBB4841751.1 sulfur-oxidizing protein SoxY [Roseateles oligotrophus]
MQTPTLIPWLLSALLAGAPPAGAATAAERDPLGSMQWPALRDEFLGAKAKVGFDPRVQVHSPAFAEDPMNVPVSVEVQGLGEVELILVLVDRNPIRKVLEFYPLDALPALSFRFKLEQASPVRAAVRTRDGRWHVGSSWVESAGGGCSAPASSRSDGSWAQHLGQVSARRFSGLAQPSGTRLRLRVMHPMDTGLGGGVPAFYLKQLQLKNAQGRTLSRLKTFEPVSENPIFSFDFASPLAGALRLQGSDNNGNRIEGAIP